MNKAKFQKNFLNNIENQNYLTKLFDFLPDIFFFVKNNQSQFVMANKPFLDILGAKKEDDIIGLCDHDFFPLHIADKYLAEDHFVLRNKTMTRDRLWLVPNSDNTLKWYLSTKIPLFDKSGNIAGLSVSQFDRRFNKVFGMSPLKYITKTRIDAACITLNKTHKSCYVKKSQHYIFLCSVGITLGEIDINLHIVLGSY